MEAFSFLKPIRMFFRIANIMAHQDILYLFVCCLSHKKLFLTVHRPCSHLALECVFTCVLSDHLLSDLTSPFYMQTNT